MSSTNRGVVRNERDLYKTPQWVCDAWAREVDDLVLIGPHDDDIIISDLGCGDGRIGQAIGDVVRAVGVEPLLYGCDIETDWEHGIKMDLLDVGIDETIPDMPNNVIFVSNPPFSLSMEFVEKTVKYVEHYNRKFNQSDVASFLLRLNFLGSKKRHSWLTENPPSCISVLSSRPSFTGCGTDSCEYAIFWWGLEDCTEPFRFIKKP